MPLIVETGEGITGADSYAAVETATAYWTDRPQDPNAARWTAAAQVTGKQDGALREATSYLDANWGALFPGSRLLASQGRAWPRINRSALNLSPEYPTLLLLEAAQVATDLPLLGADGLPLLGLPPQIVEATIELAARATVARLAQDLGNEGWLKRRKTGPIEREWGGPGIPGGSYGIIDNLLGPVLIGARNAQWNWR